MAATSGFLLKRIGRLLMRTGSVWLVGIDLLNPDVSEQESKAIRRAATPNIGFYAAVIVLSVLVPKVAVFGYLVIAIAAVWERVVTSRRNPVGPRSRDFNNSPAIRG